MRITAALLRRHGACAEQVAVVKKLWPHGAQPTVKVLTEAAAEGLDPWWLWNLLPAEGPGSQRAYALWCAEQVAHLCADARVAECLTVVRRRVEDPASVSDGELEAVALAAGNVAGASGDTGAVALAVALAAGSVARDTGAVALAVARAARDTTGEAQIACLSDLLMQAEEVRA